VSDEEKGVAMGVQAVTVADILVHLRDKIVEARNRGDGDGLTRLLVIVAEFEEIAENYGDRELMGVRDNLSYAIHDWFYGAPMKSTIPTAEDIRTYLERRDGNHPDWVY
jgi:hypothetical protein